jgi:predicted RNase H-like HicB family nuclease
MRGTVELVIHLEPAGEESVWWAESPDVEGFSAAAPTLAELRVQATAALRDIVGRKFELRERLVGGEVQPMVAKGEMRVVHADPIPG